MAEERRENESQWKVQIGLKARELEAAELEKVSGGDCIPVVPTVTAIPADMKPVVFCKSSIGVDVDI